MTWWWRRFMPNRYGLIDDYADPRRCADYVSRDEVGAERRAPDTSFDRGRGSLSPRRVQTPQAMVAVHVESKASSP
jgi:hypothetical protein